ncbi:MAG: tetratricopeptide repeat protein [Asticcacaulis sp.]|uniref:tetratricopeptide repeat protein n=1 Tax=Asticcacaulis sp. TaxID=1872648 RepID=UPI003F7BB990
MKWITLPAVMLALPLALTANASAAAPVQDETARQAAQKEAWRVESQQRRDKLQKAIEKGDADAMADMGAILEQGDGAGRADPGAALDLYERAAAKRNHIGLRKICIAYLLGEGRPVDLQKGLNACYALPKDDAVYIFASAYDYEHGITGPKSVDVAPGMYLDAVKVGSGEAADALGRIVRGMSKADAARAWFRQGVYLNSPDAIEHYAEMLEMGEGGAADPAEAAWLYAAAAKRGNAAAQTWLGGHPQVSAPDRVTMVEGRKEMSVTRHYGVADKAHSESMTPSALAQQLTGSYPRRALRDRVEGEATIQCYINARHEVDACVIANEYPPGYDFGLVLGQIFAARLTVGDEDAKGAPTANKTMALRLKWRFR